MKTIQMTIDEKLLAEVDRVTADLHTPRSAFIRDALERAIRRQVILDKERRDAEGYARCPSTAEEAEEWVDEQVWGDE